MEKKEYICREGIIISGTTNEEIDLISYGDPCDTVFISNDSPFDSSFTVKINSIEADAITLKSGKSIEISKLEMKIAKVFLSNSSTDSLEYQIIGVY